jgi:hypothetical protein
MMLRASESPFDVSRFVWELPDCDKEGVLPTQDQPYADMLPFSAVLGVPERVFHASFVRSIATKRALSMLKFV